MARLQQFGTMRGAKICARYVVVSVAKVCKFNLCNAEKVIYYFANIVEKEQLT